VLVFSNTFDIASIHEAGLTSLGLIIDYVQYLYLDQRQKAMS